MSTPATQRWQFGALALAIAMALPGTALAQTDKERELEARVAQLEHMVQQLLEQRGDTDTRAAVAAEQAAADAAAARAKVEELSSRAEEKAAPRTAWQVDGPDNSSIKFGFLAQMRGEAIDADNADTTTDLFFRRLRLLAGGKINDQWSFFLETDSPNLGKGESDGTKNTSDIFFQDFVVTYKPRSDAFMLDFGQLLGEVTYNSNQSAASLMATDYGATSFVWAGHLDTRVGRDYGVRARGYLFNDRLEYRGSVLQGNRGTDSSENPRFLGRVMFNIIGSQKSLYYTGTTMGKKQLLSVGASYDTQEDYDATSVDAFWDQPLAGGNGVTAQASWSSLNGDSTFGSPLPDQDNIMLEAGFYHARSKLLPFVQYTNQNFDDARPDIEKTMVGFAYAFAGHNGNVKFSYANVNSNGGKDRDEWWLQLQLFKF